MRRVAVFVVVAVLACLVNAYTAEAKGGGNKGGGAKPDKIFAKMDTDKNGFVNHTEYLDYAKAHPGKKGFDEGKANRHYDKIIGSGDAAKGFDLAAYKAFLEQKAEHKKHK